MATKEVGHLMRHRQCSIRYCFLRFSNVGNQKEGKPI